MTAQPSHEFLACSVSLKGSEAGFWGLWQFDLGADPVVLADVATVSLRVCERQSMVVQLFRERVELLPRRIVKFGVHPKIRQLCLDTVGEELYRVRVRERWESVITRLSNCFSAPVVVAADCSGYAPLASIQEWGLPRGGQQNTTLHYCYQ